MSADGRKIPVKQLKQTLSRLADDAGFSVAASRIYEFLLYDKSGQNVGYISDGQVVFWEEKED